MAEQLICNEKSVVVREGTFLPTLQSPYNFTFATVAQLVEQLIRNQQVAGSSPASSSKNTQKSKDFWVFYIGIALLFKYRLRDVDALAAAVVEDRKSVV